jgi:hypothetical protein
MLQGEKPVLSLRGAGRSGCSRSFGSGEQAHPKTGPGRARQTRGSPNAESTRVSLFPKILFYCDRFGQIARLINIQATDHGDMVGQQL